MSTTKTDIVTNFEANVTTASGRIEGRKRTINGTIALESTDLGAADIVLLAPLPTAARVVSIKLYSDDLDSGSTNTCDVGLYRLDGTAKDDDCYASAITTLRSAGSTGTEVAFEARDINKMGQQVWQDAGDTSDPGGQYYLALTFDAAGNQAGDLSFKVEYIVT